jgi:hypothetical protein
MNSHLENALNYLLLAQKESEYLSFDHSQILNTAIENISQLLTELGEEDGQWTPPTPYDFSIADLLIEACQ